ncbi:MAG: hypothetical protein R3C56_17900 [Pirellulaceae bacterium]
MQSAAGATLTRLADDSILASGPSPANDTYTLTFDSWPADITALRIDAIPDESLPHSGPGRAGNGNFVLTELELGVLRGDQISPIALQNASATFEQKMGAAGGHPDKKWSRRIGYRRRYAWPHLGLGHHGTSRSAELGRV